MKFKTPGTHPVFSTTGGQGPCIHNWGRRLFSSWWWQQCAGSRTWSAWTSNRFQLTISIKTFNAGNQDPQLQSLLILKIQGDVLCLVTHIKATEKMRKTDQLYVTCMALLHTKKLFHAGRQWHCKWLGSTLKFWAYSVQHTIASLKHALGVSIEQLLRKARWMYHRLAFWSSTRRTFQPWLNPQKGCSTWWQQTLLQHQWWQLHFWARSKLVSTEHK